MHLGIGMTLAKAFYGDGMWGLARRAPTNRDFQQASANTIAFICAAIYHAISEYDNDGKRRAIPFHGHTIEGTQIFEMYTRLTDKSQL